MTCKEAAELLSAALDGELNPGEERALQEHLAECPACRALQDDLLALHAVWADMDTAPPPQLKKNIMENLPPRKAVKPVVAIHWKRWGAMAAAFVLVALAAWQLPKLFVPKAPVPPEAPMMAMTAGAAADEGTVSVEPRMARLPETADETAPVDCAKGSLMMDLAEPEPVPDPGASVYSTSEPVEGDDGERPETAESTVEVFADPLEPVVELPQEEDYCGVIHMKAGVLELQYPTVLLSSGKTAYVLPADEFWGLEEALRLGGNVEYSVDAGNDTAVRAAEGLVIPE